MAKAKGRAQQFQDDEHITKDYDPEANVQESDKGSDSEVSEDDNLATEHYVAVGKSKLREKENVSLGPQYRGARVNRSALEQDSSNDEDDEEGSDDDDYADPETVDVAADEAVAGDSEIDSDDALAESDAERFEGFAFRGSSKPSLFKKGAKRGKGQRATASDFMSDSEDEEGSGVELDSEDLSGEDEDMDDGLDALANGGGSSDEDEEVSGEDEEDDGEDEDEDEDEDEESDDEQPRKSKSKGLEAKPQLAALSNRADVTKGMAIQDQRKAYDALLNLRIRLQKALVAANTFPTLEGESDIESEPYEAAEEAAIKLLNTISSLRENFDPTSKTGGKRKRAIAESMSSEKIWEHLQAEDRQTKKFREDRLEKWSRKVQSINVTTASNGLGARSKTLIGALQEQLATPDNRLVKKTRVPRSCAPAQAAQKLPSSETIYDDADFYQVLLKELVDQRTVETDAAQVSAVLPSVMLNAAKEAKSRKVVDRKASKGRKMRFTVHEKLQNFMAAEDRGSWEKEAADRLFGTLFGRKMMLDEEEDEEEGMDAEEEGLRLFRG